MRLFISVLLFLLVLQSAMAALDPTQVTILQVPSDAYVDDHIRLEGQLTYANGSEIPIGFMWMINVDVLINGVLYGSTYCNATGHFGGGYKVNTIGQNTVEVIYKGKPFQNLAGCESSLYLIDVVDTETSGNSNIGMIKFISYAKGLFALTFFSVLGITIGMGCYSAYTNDPQKKAASEESLFALLKISATVTIFYLAVLFLIP